MAELDILHRYFAKDVYREGLTFREWLKPKSLDLVETSKLLLLPKSSRHDLAGSSREAPRKGSPPLRNSGGIPFQRTGPRQPAMPAGARVYAKIGHSPFCPARDAQVCDPRLLSPNFTAQDVLQAMPVWWQICRKRICNSIAPIAGPLSWLWRHPDPGQRLLPTPRP